MTHTTPQQKQIRRNRIYVNTIRIGTLALVALLAITGAVAFVQTQRVDNLRGAVQAEATTAATQYSELSTQYSKLFEACQKSSECLASAPAEQAPVIIQGTPGTPGKSVTPGEIADALNAYCAAHQNCIGDSGAAGAAGATGQAGSDGSAGQPGQDGAPGATGPAGPAGADGRGVASISCISIGVLQTAFEFTLTDGTVFDITGSCTPA